MPVGRALVRRPAATCTEGITSASLGAPNFAKTVQQHAAYCQALRRFGAVLTLLDADENYPDAHFVEDAAVVIGERAILTRPGAEPRRGEVSAIGARLRESFSFVDAITPPGTVDGGDVCEADDAVYIGISQRTNRHGAMQLGDFVRHAGKTPIPANICDISGMLHLKSGLAYVGDGRFVAVDALASRLGLDDRCVIRVRPDEAYAANCVLLNDVVLVAAGFPGLQQDLNRCGYCVVPLDVSEFRKMDGGLSCLSLRF